MGRLRLLILSLIMAMSAGGCQFVWQGNLRAVRPDSDKPRVGNVYLVRGWIGVFSRGVDQIAEQLQQQGVRAHVYQDAQRADLARALAKAYRGRQHAEPLVLVGHSYGADDVVAIARDLQKARVKVDLLVTLDPVIPPRVPDNVVWAENLYRSNGLMDNFPWLRGIPLKADVPGAPQLVNSNLKTDRPDLMTDDTNHFTIEKNPRVQQEVVRMVLAVCPPRERWAQAKQEDPCSAQ